MNKPCDAASRSEIFTNCCGTNLGDYYTRDQCLEISWLMEEGVNNMAGTFKELWNDEQGFLVSAELVLIATILVIGLIVGFTSIQHAVVAEMNDVGDSIGALNQSY